MMGKGRHNSKDSNVITIPFVWLYVDRENILAIFKIRELKNIGGTKMALITLA